MHRESPPSINLSLLSSERLIEVNFTSSDNEVVLRFTHGLQLHCPSLAAFNCFGFDETSAVADCQYHVINTSNELTELLDQIPEELRLQNYGESFTSRVHVNLQPGAIEAWIILFEEHKGLLLLAQAGSGILKQRDENWSDHAEDSVRDPVALTRSNFPGFHDFKLLGLKIGENRFKLTLSSPEGDLIYLEGEGMFMLEAIHIWGASIVFEIDYVENLTRQEALNFVQKSTPLLHTMFNSRMLAAPEFITVLRVVPSYGAEIFILLNALEASLSLRAGETSPKT